MLSEFTPARLKYLAKLLVSIASQERKDFETIIVVDGAPLLFDEVNHLVSQIGPPNPRVVLSEIRIGASRSRNLGARVARGDVISFVDDDVALARNWADEVVELFRSRLDIDGIAGSAYPMWEDERDAWLPLSLYWVVSCTAWFGDAFRETGNMWTMNAAIRRRAFLEVGGFSEELGPAGGREAGFGSLAEDLELTIRLKRNRRQIFYAPRVKCFHHIQHSQVTLAYVVRRSFWIGRERRMLFASRNFTDGESRVLYLSLRELLLSEVKISPRYSIALVKGKVALLCSLLATLVGFLS